MENLSLHSSGIIKGIKKHSKYFFVFLLLLVGITKSRAQTTYNLVTSTSQLVAGSKYIVVSTQTVGSGVAMGLQNTNNRAQVTITVATGPKIITTPASSPTDTKPFEITLGGTSGAWTLFDAVNSIYLASPGTGSNNYLKSQATNGTWTISFSSNAAVITCTNGGSGNNNILRYNTTSSLFSCYGSGQAAVYLYQAAASCTIPTTNAGSITTNTTTATTSNYSFTRGNGDDVLIVARLAATTAVAPTSGTSYIPSTVGSFTGTTTTGAGNIVIYNGTAAGASLATGNLGITNLTAGNNYAITAYEYTSATSCYNTTSPGTGSFFTLSTVPGGNPAAFSASATDQTHIGLSFSALSTLTTTTGYLIFQRQSNAATTFAPSNATAYTVNNTYGDGTLIANITNTSTTSLAISSLTGGTQYYYTIIPYNYDGSNSATYNYYTTTNKTATATTTAITAPTITTPTATSIVNTTATLGGNTTSNGGASLTATGVVWSVNATNANPVIGGSNVTNVVSGTPATGVFTVNATGLPANTTIAYSAYATNSIGTTYTTATTFTTLATASKLAYGTAPPASGGVNSNLTTFTVLAQRPNGSTDAEYAGAITIALVSGTNNLTGTLSVNAVAGVATFSAVQFSAIGTYTIDATASGLTTSATSSNIVITLANSTVDPWINTGGSTAWCTGTNWNSGAAPLSTEVAQFNNAGTATFSGITFTTCVPSIPGIEVSSARTRAMDIGSSASTAGTLTLTGGVINGVTNVILRNASAFDFTLKPNVASSGAMAVALGNATANVINVDGAGDVIISSVISGSGQLTKAGIGTGDLNLSGTNTYTGKTVINTGYITPANETAFGTAPGSFTANQITLNGGGIKAPASIAFNSSRGITLGSSGGLFYPNTNTITLTSIVTGSGNLTVASAGTVVLNGVHTYTGATTITAGTLKLGIINSFPDASALSISSGASFDINGISETIGSLAGAGTVTSTVTGTPALTIGADNTSTAFSGIIQNGSATAIAFVKSGAGTTVLSGANTYTGLTTVSGGVLQLNRTGGTTIPATNSIAVSGGTLQVSKNQTIANFTMSAGTLTVDAGTTLTITGTYSVSGGTINNLGTINFNGAAISFPGAGATVNNGTANTLTALTVTTGSVTLSASIIISSTLSLATGTSLAINGNTLTTTGAISGTGTLTGSPLSSLVLNGTTGTINFTRIPDTLLNLTLGTSASVTIGSSLGVAAGSNTVPGKLTLGSGAVLNTGNKLTLLSDNNSTAMVASIPEASNGTALATINGTVTVNRYVHSNVNVPTAPANGVGNTSINNGLRAWRLLTAPVTQAGSVSIRTAWQNSGIPYLSSDASTKGIGTLISGPAGGNGLDAVSGVSLYSWTTGSQQAFTAVSNTTVPISNGNYGGSNAGNTGYMLFIRGDRDPATLNNPNNGGVNINNTMLNPTGNLITGRQVYNVTPSIGYGPGQARFTLIGNPYAAPVDLSTLASSNLRSTFYVWNPNLNTVGGFVTVDFGAGVNISIPNKGANQYLQSGQAFLVYGDTSTINPTTLTFDETNKVSNNNNYVFRPASVTESFTSNLYLLDSTTATLADGNIVQYSNGFSASVDNLDALKLTNSNENFALIRNGVKLSIERRPVISTADTLYFNLTQTTARKYQFQFMAAALNHPGLVGFFKDSYTGDSTTLDLNNTTTVNFQIDTSKASKAADRFMVIFKTIATPLPVTFTNIKAAQHNSDNITVSWDVQNEINIKAYEVEKSTDGKTYSVIGTVIASGKGIYNLEDIYAIPGANYYRIHSIDANGTTQYSSVAKVVISAGSPAVAIYPNPVQDGQVGVQFTNMPKGFYIAKLMTTTGQLITTKTINHLGGSSMQTIPFNKTLSKGIYQLEIYNTDTNASTTCKVQYQ